MSEPGMPRTFVIVGASTAGASAAETLRREGFAGRIVLLGAEPTPPYDRPALSKSYLLGTVSEERIALRPPEWYAEQQVELRTQARAVALDAAARQLTLASGERVAYDALLLATGSEPRLLDVPGAELDGVRYLRTLDDARALAEEIRLAARAGGRAAIIGAGFIGAEVASACRAEGLDVTVIELLPVPLERALGAEVGALFAAIHRAHGVDLRLGTAVAELRGDGRVEEVVTTRGERIPCSFVVVGVGVRPADAWLDGSGIARANGVSINAYCETNLPGVYAAGDIANWPLILPGEEQPLRVRVEHWDNALRQAECAAKNMLGQRVAYAPVPYFWSDQYQLKLQFLGHAAIWDTVIFRGEPARQEFVAFYKHAGRVRAALAVNRVRDFVALKKLVGTGAPIEDERLRDEGIALKTLAASLSPC